MKDYKNGHNEVLKPPPPIPTPTGLLGGIRTFTEETAPSSVAEFGERQRSSRQDGAFDDLENDDNNSDNEGSKVCSVDCDGEGEEIFLEPPSTHPTALTSSSATASILDPPLTRYERWRDRCFKILSGQRHFWVGISVMFLIVVSGAVFFFMLIGAQTLCRPRTDCNPRNEMYNISIQILNVLFSYLATVSLPWRVANAIHLCGGSFRRSDQGLDLYGQPSEEIWFHIPPRRRLFMVVLLIGNSLTQYANQATRIVFRTYELQDNPPGNIWTNVFFVSSMLLAMVAGFWQLYEETTIRQQHPERFPAGPVAIVRNYWSKHRKIRRQRRREKSAGGGLEVDLEGSQGGSHQQKPQPVQSNPTLVNEQERKEVEVVTNGLRNSLVRWFKNDEKSLNMWGL